MNLSALIVFTGLLLIAGCTGGTAVDAKVDPIQFAAVDGTKVNTADLHGKVVLVDFWASWCGPCMAEAPHMVEIDNTYGPKGLQILGINLDDDKQRMLKAASDKGFTWPQYFDGQGWDTVFAKRFGVDGIPFAILIGTDGRILWKGHPGDIDSALASAFPAHT